MNPNTCNNRVLLAWLVGLCLTGEAFVGCEAPEVAQEVNRRGSNLQSLGGMYKMYASQNRGIPPANEGEFKRYILAQGLGHFADFGITTIDDLFISPRDGQPYMVVYGGRELPDVLAYEQIGSETGRWIVSSMALVAEVDEATFDQMILDE